MLYMKLLVLTFYFLKLFRIRCSYFRFFMIFIGFISIQSFAQNEDSLQIKLFNQTDLINDTIIEENLLISSQRLTSSVNDISNQLIIIDGDEIRKFGYTTLGDVLKSIPGIMTSQPGNAIEGETFIIRGLIGNESLKFMINGASISPEAVRGMPIGAQLPIRHAQRIEISLGPSSTYYGSGCIGGYVNIVMPEVEHPIYAWSDINIATPSGNDFNLTLGGKKGLGKNIFKYQLFASSLKLNDVLIEFDDADLLIDYSLLDSGQINLVHATQYDSNFNSSESSFKLEPMTKESRTMGTNIQYRRFDLSVMTMFREENSGFGFHPLQHSYHNQNFTLGEKIISGALTIKLKNTSDCQSRLLLSYLDYRMLPYSSYYGLANKMSNGRNFMYAQSNLSTIDFHSSRIIDSNLKLNYGFINTYEFTLSPFTNYNRYPTFHGVNANFIVGDNSLETQNMTILSSNEIKDSSSIASVQGGNNINSQFKIGLGAFFQGQYSSNSGRFIADASIRLDLRSKDINAKRIGWISSPKFGCVYSLNENAKLKFNYAQGFKYVGSYYLYNNYLASYSDFDSTGKIDRKKFSFKPEKIKSVEIGFVYVSPYKSILGITYCGHLMNNKIFNQTYTFDTLHPNSYNLVGFAFYNSTGISYLNTLSVTFDFPIELGLETSRNLKPFAKIIEHKNFINIKLGYDYSKGKEFLYSTNDTFQNQNQSSPYRYVPTHIFKLNIDVNYKGLIVSFRNSSFGNFTTSISRVNETVSYTTSQTSKTVSNYNLDVYIYKELFRQLSVFTSVSNVFNKKINGIPYADLSSIWTSCPQYGRILKFGLTFKLN